MSTTTVTMPSTPILSGRVDKASKKQTMVVTLHISPTKLKKFLSRIGVHNASTSTPTPTPTATDDLEQSKQHSLQQDSESNSTPAPTQDDSTPNGVGKKKSSVAGIKRSTPMSDSTTKPKGKPGPKKKPRLDDGTIDHAQGKPTTNANPRLGPKANTGFINANLRALDRTGTPCRRWEKKGLRIKSFTGVTWDAPGGWMGNGPSLEQNKIARASQEASLRDSSDQKPSESDTAKDSNIDDNPDKMELATPAASSPPQPPSSIQALHPPLAVHA